MTCMKQILQERSMFFSKSPAYRETMKAVKGLTPKDIALLGQIAVQDPKAAELRRLVIKADRLLKTNDGNTINSNEKLTTYAIAMMRIFADAQYLMTLAFNYSYSAFTYTALGGNLPLTITVLLPLILSSIVFVIVNRVLRKTINKREREINMEHAKKLLIELKILEKKVPESEKIKIREHIDKIEYVLNEKYNN